jgi:hypothetical protein
MATASLPARGTEPVRLFISYARVDREPVERLAKALTAAGFSVWWDAALEGGHHFAAEIERELTAADAVVVVWSEASVISNWVLDEAMYGRDRGCLIPVRFDDTPPPLGYRQIQTIDLADGVEGEEVAAIGRAAARILGQPAPEPRIHARSGGKPAKGFKTADGKREYPLWWPFAWAIFGLIVFLILNGLDYMDR